MSFGPGSAFSFAAPQRPPRRNNSQGSFKLDTHPAAPSNQLGGATGGPTPVDPPVQPSLGSFSSALGHDSLLSSGTPVNGAPEANGTAAGRSFSSILSPPLSSAVNGGNPLNGAGEAGSKPFVYSREFLLSLYDEDKARKRPIELAHHETATRDLSAAGENGAQSIKPWLMQEYREGEKELFATSIHPANSRPSRLNRTESTPGSSRTNGASGDSASATLDLSTLGTLPRDRDRALGSPSIRSPSIEKDGILGSSAGRERRTRERSSGGVVGIMGGVLGGIAATGTRKRDEGGAGGGGKEVWQGGRWRRGAQEAEAEETVKRTTSAFGSRRFPLPEDQNGSRPASPGAGNNVPDSWDDGENDGLKAPTGSSALNGEPTTGSDALLNEPEITASVLGSLALDSVDDPLLARPSGASTPLRPGPPPGLSARAPAPAVDPATVEWQYRDTEGTIQGPFVATMMHDWFRQQFFNMDLRVKRTTDAEFESLEQLIQRVGSQDRPFLMPKPQTAPPSAFSSAPGTPHATWGAATPTTQRAQTPLEQLTAAVAQGRLGGGSSGSFYEPFGSSAAPSPAPQSQTLPQAFGAAGTPGLNRTASTQGATTPAAQALDPWGAPLPSATTPGAFQHLQQQQQQLFPGQPPVHSPADLLLRQLAHQQQQQQQQFAAGLPGATDVFGRPSPLPQSPFFDPSQLVGSPQLGAPAAWLQQQMFQQQQLGGQQPWNVLGGGAQSPVVQMQQQAAPSPIGPPAQQFQQPQQQQQQQAPAPVQSPWDAVKPAPAAEPVQQEQPAPVAVEVKETVVVAKPETPAAPAAAVIVEEVKVVPAPAPAPAPTAAPAKEKKAKKAAAAPAPEPVVVEKAPSPVPEPAPSPAASSSAASAKAAAPWAKEEIVAAAAPAASPSLREIQEAEAREADKRKAAARIQATQASIAAAQRAAQLEAQQAAEALPPSASWAAGPAQVPPVKQAAAAPWIAGAATTTKPSGKTLKEIQEEEEKRKKAAAAAQAQASGGAVPAGKGYAGSIGQAAAAPGGAAWTTVAVKPAVVRPAAAAAKPLIPGLPSTATTASSVRAAGASGLPVKPAAAPAAARPAAPVAAPAASPAKVTIVPRSVTVSAPATTVYDMENPPPPSAEFMTWTKQALKGLNVPLDEFIQMLLSFPLESSDDVLEIISDSVYANSSTLDGRRFANDFANRRKNDVAVRYPSIFAKGAVRAPAAKAAGSMAAVLGAPQQPKTSEWNVKVSAKKKKGGK
ncbi:hypothetical protein JCM10213_000223 [Rhodosporidiobolus nylandii]